MLAIQPWCGACGDEELGSIGIRACIGHGEHSFLVFHIEVFICKLATVDGLPPGAIASLKIPTWKPSTSWINVMKLQIPGMQCRYCMCEARQLRV